MTDGMLSQTEGEASGAGMRCGWRQWAAMWATVLVGSAILCHFLNHILYGF